MGSAARGEREGSGGGKAIDDLDHTADDSRALDSVKKGAKWDRRWQILSVVSFALGCVWLLLFPVVTVTTGEAKPRGTFFDENALLVHHTSVKLPPKDIAWARPNALRRAYPTDSDNGATWICAVLRGMDLPCYAHTYYEHPAERIGLRTSVYTVLEPAPGADGKDCMVLTTAQDLSGPAQDMLGHASFTGVSLALAIMKHLQSRAGWMSKRLILLVADEDVKEPIDQRLHLGVKAFVDDYHTDTLDLLARRAIDSNMTGSIRHSGVMRAALTLENLADGEPILIQLLTSGLNGELPNMDLLNAAVFHLERQGHQVSLDTCSKPLIGPPFRCDDAVGQAARVIGRLLPIAPEGDRAQAYLTRLTGLLGFLGSGVMGPSGPHAHFLRHSIDALTIRALGSATNEKESEGRRVAAGASASWVNSVVNMVRGVSNLEEDLHHSFFGYQMLSTSAFVSIGEYAYALVLLLIPLVLQGRRLGGIKRKTVFASILLICAFEVLGALLLCAANYWPEPLDKFPEFVVAASVVAGQLLLLGIGTYSGRQSTADHWPPSFFEGPQTVMACVLAYSCTVAALLSWPVAAAAALTHVPPLVMARPVGTKRVPWAVIKLIAAFCSPPVLVCLAERVTRHTSGTGVLLHWLRWFRLAGLLNLPFLCLVSIPVHLTVCFVMFGPRGRK